MSIRSKFSECRGLIIPLLAFVLVFALIAAPAVAQLTQKNIDAMQKKIDQEGWTFTVGLCEANSKYSIDQLCGLKKPDNWKDMAPLTVFTATQAIPSTWDWREMDGVTPVKNQLQCGACWAFATIGPIESVIRIRDAKTVDLAEQWLVSCNDEAIGPLPDWSCDGGWFAYDYFIDKKDDCNETGGVLEQYFAYAATELPCNCPYPRDYWIDDWFYIDPDQNVVPPPEQIKQAIMEWGPVGVGVYVNDYFQGYGGGVFNGCEVGTTNHAVTIVGWDDDYLGQSVWIVKNSWGRDWGIDGYMLIPFGCSVIGEAASYVDYDLPGVFFWSDTTYGQAPLDVNFDAFSPLAVDTWTWDFGDGDSAFVQTPATHTFSQRGSYDITIEIDAGGDIRTLTKSHYIVAIADTLLGDTIATAPETQVEMVLTAHNSAPLQYMIIPVEFDNPYGLMFDSSSTVGCRTDYFELKEYLHYDPWYTRSVTLKLTSSTSGSSPDLEPGEGPVAKLYFTVPVGMSGGDAVTVFFDGYSDYVPTFGGEAIEYQIPYVNGYIEIATDCCDIRGDFDHDGTLNPLDPAYFVDWLWGGGAGPECMEEADTDGSGGVDPLDVSYLVAYFWGGGPAPVPCP